MDEEDCSTWISLESATRNLVVLLCLKKEGAGLIAPVCGGEEGNRSGLERLPATLTGWGAGVVAGLASDTDREELVTAAGSTGSAVAGQQPLSAPACTGASADLKRGRG